MMDNDSIAAHLWKCCSSNNVVTISNHQITSLAFGKHHCLFLTSNKKVFSFGKNDYGQLGTGCLTDHPKEPHFVQNLPSKIKSINCGPYVSCVLTEDGELYVWGRNEQWQCGIDGEKQILLPTLLEIYETPQCEHTTNKVPNGRRKIMRVSCGAFHTLALTSNSREIWVWGTGIQLGIQGTLECKIPTKLNLFSGRKIISLACGYDYSLVVLQSTLSQINEETNSYNNDCIDCDNESKCPLGLTMGKTSLDCEDLGSNEKLDLTYENNVEVGSPIREKIKLSLNQDDSPEKEETTPQVRFSDNESYLENFHERSEQRDSLSPEVELRRNRPLVKRAGSILDPEIAKQYLEKLTDAVFSPDNEEDEFSNSNGDILEKADDGKMPFVWGVVSKVRNSLDKIQMGHFLSSGTHLEKSFSQESFEVLETNLLSEASSLDGSSGSFPGTSVKRSGSLKSLLELKRGQKLKESNHPARKISMEAFITIGRDKGKRNKLNELKLKKTLSDVSKDFSSHETGNGIPVLNTEVWSFGVGKYGQLGHGDDLDRVTGCCVKQLSGQGVVRVLAGNGHSIALTADGRVISWGNNSHGQLGHSFKYPIVLTPKSVELPSNELIWDVSTGESRTIFLVDHRAPRVAMYYCGSHEIENDTPCVCPKEEGIHQLNILKKSGLIERVFGGGPYLGCLVNPKGLSELPILHEFAATERWFLYQLQILLSKLLSPLLKEINSLPETFREPLKSLIAKLTSIIDITASNSYDLTTAVLARGNLESINFVRNVDEWIEHFLIYSEILSDVIAVNTCSYLAKEWSWTPNKLKMLARDTLGETTTDHKTSAEILLHLLSIPVRRARDYLKLINKFATSNLKEMNTQELFTKSQALIDTVAYNFKLAENTRSFWETAPQKIIENYRTASRRIIRESKTHQLHLQSSGRFTSHWFILFNDILTHQHFSGTQSYPLQIVWIEPLPDTETVKNAFLLRMPEDVLTLSASNSSEKTEWICAFNASIRELLDRDKEGALSRLRSPGLEARRLSPPLPRNGAYTFLKTPFFKDALYEGMWLCGKVHGQGTLIWPDGKKYVGKFKQNYLQGEGVLTVPHGDREYVYDGFWHDNKLSGYGSIRYPNGDSYEGYFKEGQRSGHGMLKQGQMMVSAASVYIGQWANDERNGYGVLDNIPKGEKYMGMWQDDLKHGKGLVVTIDGVYYEGNFINDKLQGFGVMMFEDGTFFEGNLGSNGSLEGQGVLFLSNGDHIDGTFNGIWSSPIKLNGHYHKSTIISSAIDFKIAREKKKWTYGQLCVPASAKWLDIFKMCRDNLEILGIDEERDNRKAWEAIAIALAKQKKGRTKKRHARYNVADLRILERIPKTSTAKGTLTIEDYREIQEYLQSASDCAQTHPVGQLIENIVDVYRAAYLGIGAHKTLLPHAVSEIQMFTSRTYEIIRVLFPDLPQEGDFCSISLSESEEQNLKDSEDESDEEVVSPSSLLHPILLPRLYPPLFTLYALGNEEEDTVYWKRILKWNRQNDISLLAFLGVHQKFWMMRVKSLDLSDAAKLHSLSSFKDIYFESAIDMLQRISTEFTPRDKLKTIHLAFKEINEEVQKGLKDANFLWNMDDLFPIFEYVVVRARIRHLGSEIHLISDLMEKHYEMGELGIMFTTLKACYFQIRTEKAQQN